MVNQLSSTSPLSMIELEARLLRQEHRLTHLIYNYFHTRKKFTNGDSRKIACEHAFFIRIVASLIPGSATAAIGIISLAALFISRSSLDALKNQNVNQARTGLFAHSLSVQNIWLEHPRLRPYFYENKALPKNEYSEDYIRLMTISEMLADMLDHAISIDSEQFAKEGWDDYAQDLYSNSTAFRTYMNDPEIRSWYPFITQWITYSDSSPPRQENR